MIKSNIYYLIFTIDILCSLLPLQFLLHKNIFLINPKHIFTNSTSTGNVGRSRVAAHVPQVMISTVTSSPPRVWSHTLLLYIIYILDCQFQNFVGAWCRGCPANRENLSLFTSHDIFFSCWSNFYLNEIFGINDGELGGDANPRKSQLINNIHRVDVVVQYVLSSVVIGRIFYHLFQKYIFYWDRNTRGIVFQFLSLAKLWAFSYYQTTLPWIHYGYYY